MPKAPQGAGEYLRQVRYAQWRERRAEIVAELRIARRDHTRKSLKEALAIIDRLIKELQ